MKTRQALFLAALLAAGGANPAAAAAFTFDFQHPTGAGSTFPNAISLGTLGAVKDNAGNPIGFTKANAGDTNGDGSIGALTLTANGLEFVCDANTINGDSRSSAMLGIPFPNTGPTELTTALSMTVRFSSLTGVNQNYDSIGLGFGSPTANSAQVVYALYFYNSGAGGIICQASRPDGTPSQFSMSSLKSLALHWDTWDANAPFWMGVGTNSSNASVYPYVYDTAPTRTYYGQANEYGYLLFGRSGGDGLSGTITSISFSGTNLVIPEIPEPATCALLGIGAVALLRRRRPSQE